MRYCRIKGTLCEFATENGYCTFTVCIRERGDGMTKREFLDTVFTIAPNEANKIMDAFDEYVDSNEPHWIPVEQDTPHRGRRLLCNI